MFHKMIKYIYNQNPPREWEGLFPEEKVRREAEEEERSEAKRSGVNSIWSTLLYKADMAQMESIK